MDAIRNRLEHDLTVALARLRQAGMADALEELRPVGVSSFADEIEGIQANEWREVGCATRELLVERVKRLTAALERYDDGRYGTCAECEQSIAPARLRVMPEVETCVQCQDRLERHERLHIVGRHSAVRPRRRPLHGETEPTDHGADPRARQPKRRRESLKELSREFLLPLSA